MRWLKTATSKMLNALLVLLLAATVAQAAEKVTYYHLDALGSPVAATDAQGNTIWQERYKPYGERLRKEPGAENNTRWYTGHPHDDDTGLIYAGARYYDPVVGRFMAIDPRNFDENDLETFNRYAYGANNPYKFIDPDGRVNVRPNCWGTECVGGGGGAGSQGIAIAPRAVGLGGSAGGVAGSRLVIGGGRAPGFPAHASAPNTVTLNIDRLARPDCCGRGQSLPFRDASFREVTVERLDYRQLVGTEGAQLFRETARVLGTGGQIRGITGSGANLRDIRSALESAGFRDVSVGYGIGRNAGVEFSGVLR